VTFFDGFKYCGVAFCLTFLYASLSRAAEEAQDRQAQMAAAYVFNFVKFVEWPADVVGDTLEVCFLGAGEVRDALATSTAGKYAGNRRMVVREVQSTQPLSGCHVVYVGEQTNRISVSRALTIGNSGDFTRQGGIIRLYTESNRLRFIVNVDNAKREGIQVSSNLLKLATQVEGGAR
jgi:hypothetical protein